MSEAQERGHSMVFLANNVTITPRMNFNAVSGNCVSRVEACFHRRKCVQGTELLLFLSSWDWLLGLRNGSGKDIFPKVDGFMRSTGWRQIV